MKLEDIQPGRRYYVAWNSAKTELVARCMLARHPNEPDKVLMSLMSYRDEAIVVPVSHVIAPVPDNWLQRLLRR
jgi:hypothetical protein